MTVLSEATIKSRQLVREGWGLHTIAYQPAGVDLRVLMITRILGPGHMCSDGSKTLPEKVLETPNVDFKGDLPPYWYLNLGNYSCTLCEELHMPTDVVAFLWSRSSLCRMGCWVETAVIDPGYVGVPSVLLRVENPAGIYIEQGAPLVQVVFHTLDSDTRSYAGSYQGEGIR